MKSLYSFLVMALMALPVSAQKNLPWVGTFATAAEFAGKSDLPQKTNLANTSLREIVQVSLGGKNLQLQFSNQFSKQPVEIKSVYIADSKDSCDIDAKSATYLKFNGKKSVVIPAGGIVYCDELKYDLKPLQRLTITICYGEQVPTNATAHRGSRTTSYIAQGTVKPGMKFQTFEKLDHWYNIAQINVRSKAEAIAILGNSITDGRGSTTNLQNRWPDRMALALNGGVGVLNLGIGGNCVVQYGLSEPAMKRFDRDILGQKGVKKLIIFEGTNDIGISNGNYEHVADTMIACYKVLIAKARAHGMKVYGGTITPTKGNGWFSFFHEAIRQTVNAWIRTPGNFDEVIDFDKMARDPQDEQKLKAEYSDDWLHLNPKGYDEMGKFAAKYFEK